MSFLTTALLCIMCFILSFRVTNQQRSLTDIMCMGKRYRRHNKIMAAGALEVIKTDSGHLALKVDTQGSKDFVAIRLSRKEAKQFKAVLAACDGEPLNVSVCQYKVGGKKYFILYDKNADKKVPIELNGPKEETVKSNCKTVRSAAFAIFIFSPLLHTISPAISIVMILTATILVLLNIPFLPNSEWEKMCEFIKCPQTVQQSSEVNTDIVQSAASIALQEIMDNSNTQTGKYQQEALKCGVKFCRITRKWVKIKWKYYAQLVLEGYPPTKCDSNGVIKHPIKQGCVGLDIGTQTLAISGSDICDLRLLAPSARAQAKGLVNEIARTQRAMDRSRRATNPDCYNPDGTIKRLKCQHGHKQKRDWKYSKRYYRLRARLRDLNRRLADIRKMEHNILANELLEHGNEFIVEDMNYKALQKHSKETKVNAKTGRIHTKKRFGKSLSRCAPAMFITILTNKVTRYGGKVIKVSTFETKVSQFDHTDESYTKKKLSERMAHLSSGEVVQRDLYSAFLLEHIDTESLEYNTEALKSAFPAFLKMHENTKKHLQKEENNLPASVGF